MPGRNEQQAVTSFLRPLQLALSALSGHAQITVDRKGQYRKGRIYSWELNGGAGLSWTDVGLFTASMNFEIVDADPAKHDLSSGALRVTTRGYWYTFRGIGDPRPHRWRMHWHPEGNSPVVDPHLHRPPDISEHWPTPRMSLETAIRWCLIEGAPPSCSTAEVDNKLTEAESAFRLFGSWQDTTDPGYPLRQGS